MGGVDGKEEKSELTIPFMGKFSSGGMVEWMAGFTIPFHSAVFTRKNHLFPTVAVHLRQPVATDYLAPYITLFLRRLYGYLIGLVISVGASNQNAAMQMIIAALVPRFLFAGALLPLYLIPGGEAISIIMPTRWSFEALIRVKGLGAKLAAIPCNQVF